MKKNIFIGIFSPLFYHLVVNLMLYTILADEYSERYAFLNNALILMLPALPGIALIFLLIRNSLKEYFKSLVICFLLSFMVMVIYNISGINLMIWTKVTGYEEFSLGEGFIFDITIMSYLSSCLVGSMVACVITFIRQRITTSIAVNK